MALAIKCDACGSFIQFDSEVTSENGIVFAHFNEQGKVSKSLKNYELCEGCLNKVKDVLAIKK